MLFILMRRLPPSSTRTDTLFPYTTLFRSRHGPDAVQAALASEAAAQRRLVVVDAVLDADLVTIGHAAAKHRLVTGGSGLALGLPDNFRREGLLEDVPLAFSPTSGPAVAKPEERRVGQESVSTCRSRWQQFSYKKQKAHLKIKDSKI